MGWSSQGYSGYNRKWEVEGYTTGLNPKIDSFDRQSVDLGEYSNSRVIYGPSGLTFFHGYVFSNDQRIVEAVLSKFNGFLVYKSKYGESAHQFDSSQLHFLHYHGLTVFIEQSTFLDFEWEALKNTLLGALKFDNAEPQIIDQVLNSALPDIYKSA